VLLNAVYFKAKWASAFSRRRPATSPSSSPPEAGRRPDRCGGAAVALVAGEGYRALRLPYEVEALGMVIAAGHGRRRRGGRGQAWRGATVRSVRRDPRRITEAGRSCAAAVQA
jgi:hypothetical protein